MKQSLLSFIYGLCIMVLVGAVAVAANLAGTHLIDAPTQAVARSEHMDQHQAELQKQCLSQFHVMGYVSNSKTRTIEVRRRMSRDLENSIEQIGVAIAGCAGYELKRFCAGDTCIDGITQGITFVLAPEAQP